MLLCTYNIQKFGKSTLQFDNMDLTRSMTSYFKHPTDSRRELHLHFLFF